MPLAWAARLIPGFAQKPASAQKLDCQNRSAQKLVMRTPRRQNDGMSKPTADKPDGKRGFAVKATGATGTVCWLSDAHEGGFRVLTSREHAAVFQAFSDAYDAIAKLPRAFVDTGLSFSIELYNRA
jgi:hypothetical protein